MELNLMLADHEKSFFVFVLETSLASLKQFSHFVLDNFEDQVVHNEDGARWFVTLTWVCG